MLASESESESALALALALALVWASASVLVSALEWFVLTSPRTHRGYRCTGALGVPQVALLSPTTYTVSAASTERSSLRSRRQHKAWGVSPRFDDKIKKS